MRTRRALLTVATSALVLGASAVATGSTGAAAPAGEIAFVSNRATAAPGLLYALAPGVTPRLLSPRQYAALGLATAPTGRAYAFWSNRAGPFRMMLSRGGGSALRTVVLPRPGGADLQYPSTSPVFSPDGRRLLISYVPARSVNGKLSFALADVRSGRAQSVRLPCGLAPVFSPDGQLLACTDFRHGFMLDLQGHVRFRAPGTTVFWSADGRLAIAGRASTAIVSAQGRLLQQVAGVGRAWSPDGRYLALVRGTALVLAQPGRAGGDRVVKAGSKDAQYYWLAFTPDGRDLGYVDGVGQPQLEPVAGGPSRQLAAGFGSAWSPRGQLAFPVIKGTTATIEIGDRLGRHARVVARLPWDDHGVFTLAWLGDGSRLLANVSTRDHSDLWRMSAGGTGQTRVTSNGDRIGEPAWSADGARLAFDDAPFSGGMCGYCSGNVVVADADGRKRSVLPGADGGSSGDMSPAWSPSGTQIAVSDTFNGGVFAVALEGGARTRLAPDAAASPAWSPDGTLVAYVGSFSGGDVQAVDPTGTSPRALLPGSKLEALAVAWSPDGTQLALRTRSGVFVAPADGSAAPRRVTAAAGNADHPRLSFSPDGGRLAFTGTAGTTHPYSAIFVVGVDGSGLRRLTSGPFDSFDPAWRPVP
jgi:Tol biopolymer transport system component